MGELNGLVHHGFDSTDDEPGKESLSHIIKISSILVKKDSWIGKPNPFHYMYRVFPRLNENEYHSILNSFSR